jgi:hypothetical protein
VRGGHPLCSHRANWLFRCNTRIVPSSLRVNTAMRASGVSSSSGRPVTLVLHKHTHAHTHPAAPSPPSRLQRLCHCSGCIQVDQCCLSAQLLEYLEAFAEPRGAMATPQNSAMLQFQNQKLASQVRLPSP